MSTDPTSPQTLTDDDLDRALANAMALGDIEARDTSGVSSEDAGQAAVIRWNPRTPGRRRHNAIIGIEYSRQQLVLVDLQVSKRTRSVDGFLVARFGDTPDKQAITKLLREFNPTAGCRAQLAITSSRTVVRNFTLPAIPRKRRRAAALWEAQKLIPFPLKESETVFGFAFSPSRDKGWDVTLTAIPGADAVAVMDAVQEAGWLLEGVSVAGTQRQSSRGHSDKTGDSVANVASVLWSPIRTSFAVIRGSQLQFHYDLGPIAPPPKSAPDSEAAAGFFRDWLNTLEKGVAEALEFYFGASPQYGIDRIEIYGISGGAAPLVTGWKERFDVPVVVNDAGHDVTEALPEQARTWLARHTEDFTTALLAATGSPTVDMTPPARVGARRRLFLERFTRSALLLSIASVTVWTGLLWMERGLLAHQTRELETEWTTLQASPAKAYVEECSQRKQAVKILARAARLSPAKTMPFVKAILHTVPDQARLTTLTLLPHDRYPDGRSGLLVRLDGKVLPTGRPHSLILTEWIRAVEDVAGPGSATLLPTRTLEWKGRRSTVFGLEIRPSTPLSSEGSS